MPNRVIRHADVVIDTNIISHAVDDLDYFRRLVELLNRMLEHENKGGVWLSTTSFLEILQTSDTARLVLLLETLLRLWEQLHWRGGFLAPLPQTIWAEWKNPPATLTAEASGIVDSLRRVIRTGSLSGTWLDKARDEHQHWKDGQRQLFQRTTDGWQKQSHVELSQMVRSLAPWPRPRLTPANTRQRGRMHS